MRNTQPTVAGGSGNLTRQKPSRGYPPRLRHSSPGAMKESSFRVSQHPLPVIEFEVTTGETLCPPPFEGEQALVIVRYCGSIIGKLEMRVHPSGIRSAEFSARMRRFAAAAWQSVAENR